MAGGRPGTEASLADRIDGAIKRAHPNALWIVATTRLTPGRRGIPDRLICHQGRFIALEYKAAHRPAPLHPRQRRELYELGRAGAAVAVVDTVERALAIVAGTDPGDDYLLYAPALARRQGAPA